MAMELGEDTFLILCLYSKQLSLPLPSGASQVVLETRV